MSIDSVTYPQAAFGNSQLQQLRNRNSYADSLGLYSPAQLDGTLIASSPLSMGLSGSGSSALDALALLNSSENHTTEGTRLIKRDQIITNTDKADDDNDDDESVKKSDKEDKDRPKATKTENKDAVKKVEEEFKESKRQYENEKNHKGWIGGIWDGIKNNLGASSEEVKKEEIEGKGGLGHFVKKMWSKAVDSDNGSKSITKKMDETEEKIEAAKKDPKKVDELFEQSSKKIDDVEDIIIKGNKNGQLSEEEQEVYNTVEKELGNKTSREDVRKAIQKVMTKDVTTADIINNSEGKALTTTTKAKDYKSSQEAGVDTMASITTGLVVAGGLALAPVTGGLSVAGALAIAVPAGMAVKTGLKFSEAATGGKDYDTLRQDLMTGALDGGLSAIIPGGSSAIATGAAKTMGLTAAKTTIEEVAVQGAKATATKTAEEIALETATKEAGKKLIAKEAGAEAVKISGNGTAKVAAKSLFGKITRKEIGQFVEEDGVMVARSAKGKLLGSVEKVVTDEGANALKVTKSVGIKEALGEKSLTYLAKDGTESTFRAGIAKATGDVVMGGVANSTYSVADGVMRGDDAETIAQNARTAFVGGMVGGAVIHGAGKGLSKAVSAIKGEEAIIPTATTKAKGASSATTSVPKSNAAQIQAGKAASGAAATLTKDELMNKLTNHPDFVNHGADLMDEIAKGNITTEDQINKALSEAKTNAHQVKVASANAANENTQTSQVNTPTIPTTVNQAKLNKLLSNHYASSAGRTMKTAEFQRLTTAIKDGKITTPEELNKAIANPQSIIIKNSQARRAANASPQASATANSTALADELAQLKAERETHNNTYGDPTGIKAKLDADIQNLENELVKKK